MTLGSFERDLLTPMLKAQSRREAIRSSVVAGVGVAASLAVVGVGWLGFTAYMMRNDLAEEYQNAKDSVKTAIQAATVGLPSYATSQPPPTDGVGTDLRDPNDPMRRVNPAAGIPVVGALFGAGMVIGEKTQEGFRSGVDAAAPGFGDFFRSLYD